VGFCDIAPAPTSISGRLIGMDIVPVASFLQGSGMYVLKRPCSSAFLYADRVQSKSDGHVRLQKSFQSEYVGVPLL
jgi:hypothetical protein